uniref:Cadherin domain-containing protein n=1 Tax=Macrostomum lignano TaxID=282301 RepID=A0A1I8FHX1_9PLAT
PVENAAADTLGNTFERRGCRLRVDTNFTIYVDPASDPYNNLKIVKLSASSARLLIWNPWTGDLETGQLGRCCARLLHTGAGRSRQDRPRPTISLTIRDVNDSPSQACGALLAHCAGLRRPQALCCCPADVRHDPDKNAANSAFTYQPVALQSPGPGSRSQTQGVSAGRTSFSLSTQQRVTQPGTPAPTCWSHISITDPTGGPVVTATVTVTVVPAACDPTSLSSTTDVLDLGLPRIASSNNGVTGIGASYSWDNADTLEQFFHPDRHVETNLVKVGAPGRRPANYTLTRPVQPGPNWRWPPAAGQPLPEHQGPVRCQRVRCPPWLRGRKAALAFFVASGIAVYAVLPRAKMDFRQTWPGRCSVRRLKRVVEAPYSPCRRLFGCPGGCSHRLSVERVHLAAASHPHQQQRPGWRQPAIQGAVCGACSSDPSASSSASAPVHVGFNAATGYLMTDRSTASCRSLNLSFSFLTSSLRTASCLYTGPYGQPASPARPASRLPQRTPGHRKLRARIDLGSGPVDLAISGGPRLDDSRWHRVDLTPIEQYLDRWSLPSGLEQSVPHRLAEARRGSPAAQLRVGNQLIDLVADNSDALPRLVWLKICSLSGSQQHSGACDVPAPTLASWAPTATSLVEAAEFFCIERPPKQSTCLSVQFRSRQPSGCGVSAQKLAKAQGPPTLQTCRADAPPLRDSRLVAQLNTGELLAAWARRAFIGGASVTVDTTGSVRCSRRRTICSLPAWPDRSLTRPPAGGDSASAARLAALFGSSSRRVPWSASSLRDPPALVPARLAPPAPQNQPSGSTVCGCLPARLTMRGDRRLLAITRIPGCGLALTCRLPHRASRPPAARSAMSRCSPSPEPASSSPWCWASWWLVILLALLVWWCRRRHMGEPLLEPDKDTRENVRRLRRGRRRRGGHEPNFDLQLLRVAERRRRLSTGAGVAAAAACSVCSSRCRGLRRPACDDAPDGPADALWSTPWTTATKARGQRGWRPQLSVAAATADRSQDYGELHRWGAGLPACGRPVRSAEPELAAC